MRLHTFNGITMHQVVINTDNEQPNKKRHINCVPLFVCM